MGACSAHHIRTRVTTSTAQGGSPLAGERRRVPRSVSSRVHPPKDLFMSVVHGTVAQVPARLRPKVMTHRVGGVRVGERSPDRPRLSLRAAVDSRDRLLSRCDVNLGGSGRSDVAARHLRRLDAARATAARPSRPRRPNIGSRGTARLQREAGGEPVRRGHVGQAGTVGRVHWPGSQRAGVQPLCGTGRHSLHRSTGAVPDRVMRGPCPNDPLCAEPSRAIDFARTDDTVRRGSRTQLSS